MVVPTVLAMMASINARRSLGGFSIVAMRLRFRREPKPRREDVRKKTSDLGRGLAATDSPFPVLTARQLLRRPVTEPAKAMTTPKGLQIIAQGRGVAAHPGERRPPKFNNPVRVAEPA